MDFPILTYMIFIPLAGMIVVMLLNKEAHTLIRYTSAFFSFVVFILSCILVANFDGSTAQLQFVERADWIPSLGITYYLGADGISVPMLFLTGMLSFLSIVASFNITNRVKEYFAFFLLLEVGMVGVFCALDFFLFYIFWEVMLVPMYFLIGIWGGPRKEYAAIKFFLYTLFGSVLMLVGIIALYFYTDPHTLSIPELIARNSMYGYTFQLIVFAAFFIGFAIKVPVWPFHTWLPDAHVEAPTAVSVILAGVLLKMGTYGLMRISYPMFPEAGVYYATPVALLGMIAIIYGAFVSMAQKDLKKLVAYSSVSHMGYCMLGLGALTTAGFAGCMFQMFSHGVLTGAMFLLVGVLYDRAHTREIAAFGGIGAKIPLYTGIFILFGMGSLGLPGLSGFVSEFMVFIGAFGSEYIATWIVVVSILGVVLTAGYILRMVQRVFLGPFNTRWEDLTEMNGRELFTVIPLAIFTIFIGVYPKPLVDMITASLDNVVRIVTG
ncbi:MAG: NADH-quinone oxidoreductase subunit M [candidate division Zixibacteria bacterium]|nr:NADH-quinone oxidoreductase subunit M [candidate division Zixibacteria bacterium]